MPTNTAHQSRGRSHTRGIDKLNAYLDIVVFNTLIPIQDLASPNGEKPNLLDKFGFRRVSQLR